jgi:replicative superfamily II helicase
MTGDHDLSPAMHEKLAASNIVVMTSEMLDSRTRKFHSEKTTG